MKNTLTADRLNELKAQVGEWAAKNFTVHAPAIGILEEIGEAAHCILKRKQGIRGFDNEEYFKAQLKDAVADIAIYCFHEAYLKDFYIDSITCYEIEDDTSESILSEMAQRASYILTGYEGDLIDLLEYTELLCQLHGINFTDAVEETWAKVSKRDWKNNPTDAHAQSIELNAEQSIHFAEALTSEPRPTPPAIDRIIQASIER